MIVKEISNKQAKIILCHPDIYSVISDDNSPTVEDFEPPSDCQYIGGFVGDELIAVMVYHNFRDGVKLHIQILPEFRKKNAIRFGELGLNFGKKKNKYIYADIPIIYPNVLRYAQSFGFEIIEKIENSIKKNGTLSSSNILKLNVG